MDEEDQQPAEPEAIPENIELPFVYAETVEITLNTPVEPSTVSEAVVEVPHSPEQAASPDFFVAPKVEKISKQKRHPKPVHPKSRPKKVVKKSRSSSRSKKSAKKVAKRSKKRIPSKGRKSTGRTKTKSRSTTRRAKSSKRKPRTKPLPRKKKNSGTRKSKGRKGKRR
jgi:hypothetical protein